MAKYEFESIDELLSHPSVLKAIDEKLTIKEQELYNLEDSMKDALIKLLINEGIQTDAFQFRKLSKVIKTGKSEDIKKEYDSIVEKLRSRSIDSLKDMINDISDVYMDMLIEDDSVDSPISKLNKALKESGNKVTEDESDASNTKEDIKNDEKGNKEESEEDDKKEDDIEKPEDDINNPESEKADTKEEPNTENIIDAISSISRDVK